MSHTPTVPSSQPAATYMEEEEVVVEEEEEDVLAIAGSVALLDI